MRGIQSNRGQRKGALRIKGQKISLDRISESILDFLSPDSIEITPTMLLHTRKAERSARRLLLIANHKTRQGEVWLKWEFGQFKMQTTSRMVR